MLFLSSKLVLIDDFLLLFFFQAEDGIRDYKVTGVQTCALPILELARGQDAPGILLWRKDEACPTCGADRWVKLPPLSVEQAETLSLMLKVGLDQKIGRASCRERV